MNISFCMYERTSVYIQRSSLIYGQTEQITYGKFNLTLFANLRCSNNNRFRNVNTDNISHTSVPLFSTHFSLKPSYHPEQFLVPLFHTHSHYFLFNLLVRGFLSLSHYFVLISFSRWRTSRPYPTRKTKRKQTRNSTSATIPFTRVCMLRKRYIPVLHSTNTGIFQSVMCKDNIVEMCRSQCYWMNFIRINRDYRCNVFI